MKSAIFNNRLNDSHASESSAFEMPMGSLDTIPVFFEYRILMGDFSDECN